MEGNLSKGTVATIGTYDGVHLGHQAVLGVLLDVARSRGADPVACIFEVPPRRSIAPSPSPHLLLPIELRRRILSRYVERVVTLDFTEVRDLEPTAFVEEVLVGKQEIQDVVVGSGFRFGRGRTGSIEDLRRLGPKLGFRAHGVPPVIAGAQPISSTRIRRQVADGHVDEAAKLLGRPPVLWGRVTHGQKVGRTLDRPTANLDIHPHVLLPADGVYMAHAFWGGRREHALLYVGRRPTLGEGERRCEVHVLSEDAFDAYDLGMEVHVHAMLREDRRFDSLDALRAQIDRDVKAAIARRAEHPVTIDPICG